MVKENDDDLSFVEIYLNLKSFIVFLWSKKVNIILAGIIGAALGLTVSIIKIKKYDGRLSFIIGGSSSSSSSGLSSLAGIASSFGFGVGSEGGGVYNNEVNLMGYLKTRSLIEEALLAEIPNTKKSFADEFIETYEFNEDWAEDPRLSGISFPVKEKRSKFSIQKDSILKELYIQIVEKNECITVSKPDNAGSIIEVSVITKSKLFSQHFPEELLKIVSEKYTKDKTLKAKYNVDIIQKQTDSVRGVLNSSLLMAANVTDHVFGLNPALNVERVPATTEQIDVQVSSAVLTELIKNLELSKVQLLHETPLIEVVERPKLPLDVIEIKKLIGIIVGGILCSFLMIMYLVVSKFLKSIKEQSLNIDK